MEKLYRVHLPSNEYNHHIYAKAPTLTYSFHGSSLVGIAVILPELRLLIQQYFNIVDYVCSQ
jgi:hypothetical protein